MADTHSGIQTRAAAGGPAPSPNAPASARVSHAGGVPK